MGDNIMTSKLFCSLESQREPIFFSLVDYRNNYFTSDDPNKILEFYKGFENRDQLIQWMLERPKGVANIREVEGIKDIIVVIPTADFNGKYAKDCRENIFKGLHMVFVESGGRGDFYFNIAHNVNIGIKKSMEYNPRWVVFSGDDMYKIDEVTKLTNILSKLNSDEIDCVFIKKGLYHSIPKLIIERNHITNFVNLIRDGILGKRINDIFKKFNVKILISEDRFVQRLFYKVVRYEDVIGFGIFSFKFLIENGNKLLDETFINEGEDSDLSLNIHYENKTVAHVDYNIGDFIGMSLGIGVDRKMRAIAGLTYFNYKWDKKVLKVMKRRVL